MDARKILIADSDEVCRRIIARRLSAAGFDPAEAADGAAARNAAEKDSPDAVITELSLPKMSGLELCKNLAKRNVPVIILSHKSMLHDKITALDAGASDYMTKPFSLAELEARLRALLRKQASKCSR